MTDVDRRHADPINGDQAPLLAVHNSDNGTFPALNGSALPNLLSPATDSPNTPVSTFTPDVKIDFGYNEQESDARYEPMSIKQIDGIPKPDDASTVPQVGTPVDPGMCETFFSCAYHAHWFSSFDSHQSSQRHTSTTARRAA